MNIVKGIDTADAEILSDVKPVYDSNKKYTWTLQDQFVLSGDQFGIMLNAFRAILSTPEANQILMAKAGNDVIENIIAKAVAEGVVKEVIDSPKK
jgi:hypothetical protein